MKLAPLCNSNAHSCSSPNARKATAYSCKIETEQRQERARKIPLIKSFEKLSYRKATVSPTHAAANRNPYACNPLFRKNSIAHFGSLDVNSSAPFARDSS